MSDDQIVFLLRKLRDLYKLHLVQYQTLPYLFPPGTVNEVELMGAIWELDRQIERLESTDEVPMQDDITEAKRYQDQHEA